MVSDIQANKSNSNARRPGRRSFRDEIIVTALWHHWRDRPLTTESLVPRVRSLWRKCGMRARSKPKYEPKLVDKTIDAAFQWARLHHGLEIAVTAARAIHVVTVPTNFVFEYAGHNLSQNSMQIVDEIFEESDLHYGVRTHAKDREQLREIVSLETVMHLGAYDRERALPLIDQFLEALRESDSTPSYCALMGVRAFAALRSIRRAGNIELANKTVQALLPILESGAKQMSASHRKFFVMQLKLEDANVRFARARRLTDLAATFEAIEGAQKLVDAVLKAPQARSHHAEGRLLRGQLIAYGAIRIAKASAQDRARLTNRRQVKSIELSIKDSLEALTAAYIESLVIANWERAVACMQEIAWVYVNAGRGASSLDLTSIGIEQPWTQALEWALLAVDAAKKLSVGAYSIRAETAIIACLRRDPTAPDAVHTYLTGSSDRQGQETLWQWLESIYAGRVVPGVVMAPLARFDFVRDCAVLALSQSAAGASVWLDRMTQHFLTLLENGDPREAARAHRHLRNIVMGDEGILDEAEACALCRVWLDACGASTKSQLGALGEALDDADAKRGFASQHTGWTLQRWQQ